MSSMWAVAIFAYREPLAELLKTLKAARQATDRNTVTDILVNGNPSLTNNLKKWLQENDEDWQRLRVWSIKFGDKANAWNSYFHHIWQGESLAFFLDGYVRLRPDSISLLGTALIKQPKKLGGSGVPSGNSTAERLAKIMLSEGGFHGNFCAIMGNVIKEIKDRSIYIPIGLYRTDSLVGAWLSFGLNPSVNDWSTDRLLVHPDVTWDTPTKYWWNYSDIKATFKRKLRQARGNLENNAVRYYLANCKLPPEFLPKTAHELVNNWIADCPNDWKKYYLYHPTAIYALRSFTDIGDLNQTDTQPKLVWQKCNSLITA